MNGTAAVVAFGLTLVSVVAWGAQPEAASGGSCGEVVSLETHNGTTTRYALVQPQGAAAAANPIALVLLVGGGGYLDLDARGCPRALRGNTLVRSLPLFQEAGFITALVDSPSDHTRDEGLGGFRVSPQHAADLGKVIADVRSRTKASVWLVGTSRGTISAVNAASRLSGDALPDGVVLTSALMVGTSGGRLAWTAHTVFDLPLDAIRQPVLVVGHEADACLRSPATQMNRIVDRTNGVREQVVLVTGGPGSPGPSDPQACEGRSPHGYLEQEAEVAAGIARFVRGGSYCAHAEGALVTGLPKSHWSHGANRVLLVNLREGDEPKIDARALVEDVKSFGATAFCINGGGIVAFYQTRIPGHRKSNGLQGRDLLAEVIPAAHEAGLRVLARIDPSCAPKAFAHDHPDWFTRDRDGNFCEVSEHYVTCPNAAYYHERMPEVVREILTRYDADGIWNNQGKFAAWDTDLCYCDTCKRLFREETGAEIPREENWSDPVWRRYNEWRYRRIAAWVKRIHETVHEAKRDAIFIAAVQLMESLDTIRPGGWDIDYWVAHQDVLCFECQRRNTAPWWPGIQAKYLASLGPDRPRWMTASYFYPWWRLYASPETENRPWIAQQFANGVCTWLHINGGYSDLFDRRSLAAMRDVMQRHERWAPYFTGATSGARVALVFSRHTQDNYGGDEPHARYLDFIRGWYCALQEAHIPFDVISDKLISADVLKRYRTVVLSNLACVSDATAQAIAAFAAAGGGLVASFDAGTRDLEGEVRATPAFDALCGIRRTGRREGLKSSYAKIENASDPLLDGVGDTDLVPNEGALVEVKAAAGNAVPLTLIPPVIAHSGATISIPEYSAIRETTDIPVAVRSESAGGRVVYLCNQMEMLFYHYGFPDLGRIAANAVRWTLADERSIEVDAPDFVEATLMVQPGRRLVHLVNFPLGKPVNTGWRHIGRNLVPASDIAVRLALARGERVREARLATSEARLDVTARDGWAEVVVPKLDDHEIVIFELG